MTTFAKMSRKKQKGASENSCAEVCTGRKLCQGNIHLDKYGRWWRRRPRIDTWSHQDVGHDESHGRNGIF